MMHDTSESLWPNSLLCIDLSLPTALENLSLDEALLAAVEDGSLSPCLRFWQPADYFVVVGRSNRVETEVAIATCGAMGVPIFRRATGGGTVLVGPGCLCYSLVLPINDRHRSLGVARVTADLMSRIANGLRCHFPGIDVRGTSDLTLDGRKVSGNAQRWLRNSFIHHGTLLYDFDLSLIAQCLAHPTREPDYRDLRPHADFVMNLAIGSEELKHCLEIEWSAVPADCPAAVMDAASRIALSRYSSADWHIASSQ